MRPSIAPFLLVAGLALSGCSGNRAQSCSRIPGVATLTVNADDGSQRVGHAYKNSAALVSHLQCRADIGSQQAQFRLGQLYEAGLGVPRDLGRAAALYEKAATDILSEMTLYSAPVTRGGVGQVIRVPNPNARQGLAEAKYRLGRLYLEGRGVERDEERGRRLIDAAMAQGYRLPAK